MKQTDLVEMLRKMFHLHDQQMGGMQRALDYDLKSIENRRRKRREDTL